jgi:hypothetical protein
VTRPHFFDRDGRPMDTGDPYADTMTWGRLRDDEDYMRVDHDVLDDVTVTTVWHGINVVLGANPPRIFETMIFGGPYNLQNMRYVTKDEAAQGHRRTVEDLLAGRVPWFLRQ